MDKYRAQFFYQTAPMLGLSNVDALAVLRKAQTLHTWAVHECNGTKQREEKQTESGEWVETGRVFWYNPNTGNKCGRAVDLETGAVKSLQSIAARYGLGFEHQGDPRGYVVKLVKDGREYGVPSRG